MRITFICVAVLIGTLVPSSVANCGASGFFNRTKCHLSAAGEKVKDVAVSAYDGLAEGYDTVKSKITGNPKRTETIDVRNSDDNDTNNDTIIVFPNSAENVTLEDRIVIQVPTMNKCPAGERASEGGRCRVYS